ncbi:RNA polymerase sigma factor [Candidatus Saccharibacteria bacterium]|nr:RNA polymerase sigma factor [Candidatus Saccharibacteria bacterium]
MSKQHLASTDQAIVAQVRGGDSAAYAQLMQRYEHKLMRYVMYQVKDAALAADIVQETFIKAYENLWSYKPAYAFSTWLYRIAHNQMVSALRKQHHVVPNSEAFLADLAYEPKIAEAIDQSFTKTNVQHCLHDLDQKYRDVLQLVYFEDMSYSQVADVLRVPAATVGVWVARGKSKLRAICERKGTHHA